MAEVECWEEKEMSLAALNNSLQKRRVIEVGLIAKILKTEEAEKFHAISSRVESLLIESREISRSLAPLTNYFQVHFSKFGVENHVNVNRS
jgi:hypothetical protein